MLLNLLTKLNKYIDTKLNKLSKHTQVIIKIVIFIILLYYAIVLILFY